MKFVVAMQVNEADKGAFTKKIKELQEQAPSMHVVLCTHDQIGLESTDDSNVYTLPSMPLEAGAQLVKKLVKKPFSDGFAEQVVRNLGHNPAVSVGNVTWNGNNNCFFMHLNSSEQVAGDVCQQCAQQLDAILAGADTVPLSSVCLQLIRIVTDLCNDLDDVEEGLGYKIHSALEAAKARHCK